MSTGIMRFITIASALVLIFSLVSCGFVPGDNSDSDLTDTPTDNPSSVEIDTEKYLPITTSGASAITIVSSYSKGSEYAKEFNSFISYFKSAGISFELAYSASEDPQLPEILIGDRINVLDEHYIDPHLLGEDGYAIRVTGNKLIVAGGSDGSVAKAIKLLSSSVLLLDNPDTDIKNLAVARSTDIHVRQTYPIKSVSVGENDLFGYNIVCDVYNKDLKYCADRLHEVLYDNAGYWLSVKEKSVGASIRILITDDAGEGGFRVSVVGDDLVIACRYQALLTNTFDKFIEEFFLNTEHTDLVLTGEVYTRDISSIKYSDYGAIGDGVTDDYEAIKKVHSLANSTGARVVADSGKTYYLGQHTTPIVVKTDTSWEGATFIIDDRDVTPNSYAAKSAVFSVEPDVKAFAIKGIKSLEKGQENVGVTFDAPTLLYIVYDQKRQYIRYGNNADNGASQQEIILVDENGNVDPSTPIMWDYPSLTSVTAYSAGEKPITISGGKFITIANAAPREYTYYNRGISISRSNVTVVGVEHYIEGEGDTGAPYNGFISITSCHNILIKDTVLTGHKVYRLSSDSSNAMGTYDIAISTSNQVTFKNCRQSNSITDTTYWGIMGSNYCKNLTYDGCVFSRFDAHKGTHNATIINSEIGHQKLSIIGSGTLIVENTTVHGNNIVNLRSDYGSTWDGDMIFKNVTLKNTGTATLINGTWVNHYFGYTCHLPANITIDGITLAKGTSFYVLPKLSNGINTDTVGGSQNLNQIMLTKKITVVSNPNNYTYQISQNTTLYADVELIKE